MLTLVTVLFFHTVPELVQALFITYDKIFQALTVQGSDLAVGTVLHPSYSTDMAP
jgi:hypothetical protein